MAVVLGTIEGTGIRQLSKLFYTICPSLNYKHLALKRKNQSHTGVNIDSRVDRADFVLSGLVCATAQVETSMVLVLKGSNRRDKCRSSDDGGLHFDFRMVTDPVVFRFLSAERVKRCGCKRVTGHGGR